MQQQHNLEMVASIVLPRMLESWEDHWAMQAHLIKRRSTCLNGQVGCVAVKGNHIVGSGFNGSKPGEPHCIDAGCILVPDGLGGFKCVRTTHAEINLIKYAPHIEDLMDATYYTTRAPCHSGTCREELKRVGIFDIRVYAEDWLLKMLRRELDGHTA